ncbi:MAG: protein kinase domain-containing protein, partial [Planctomycetota bacterium]
MTPHPFVLPPPAAMPVTTTPELLDALQKTGLLADDALERAAQVVAAETEVRQAARQLIQEKILTHWQARQILAGVTNLRLGKYRLLDELGRNLLGRIYLAEHHQLARRAAVTLLSRQLSERPGAVRKFLDRAQAAAALNNPHLIQTLDVAQEANRFYVVFEFAEGRDLAERLREDGPPDVLVAIDWLQQAADGVAYLHERHIAHGNLRPELLLVDDHAVVRLLDLGVAKLSKQARAAAEATDPQQPPDPFADERPAETSADVQALIGIFYQLLTGQELPPTALDDAQLKSLEEAVELRLPGSGTPLVNLFRLWQTPPTPSDASSSTTTPADSAPADSAPADSAPPASAPPTSTPATAISAAQVRDQLLRLHQQLKPPPITELPELSVNDAGDLEATAEELDPTLENIVSETDVDSLLLSTNRPDGSGKRRSPSSVIRRDHTTAESVMAGEGSQSQQLLLRSPKSMKGKGDAAARGDRAAAKKDKAKRGGEKDGAGGAKKRQVLLIAVVASLACVLLLGAVTLGIILALSRQPSGPPIAQNQPPKTAPADPTKTATSKNHDDATGAGEIPDEPPVMEDPSPAAKPSDPLSKPESPKPESPKPESPKPESPKPESPKPETPKPETPKPETPKPETP